MIGEEKRTIRQRYLALRNRLTDEAVKSMSHEILLKLITVIQFQKARTVHCFLSASTKKEIDTTPVIDWSRKQGKVVAVPRTERESLDMSHIILGSESGLEKNRWGIYEPVGGSEIAVNDIDVILVPMVVADREKNRLGYGMGFYDRFLSRTDACKIGVVGGMFIHDQMLPVDEMDVPMDIIVTNNEILY